MESFNYLLIYYWKLSSQQEIIKIAIMYTMIISGSRKEVARSPAAGSVPRWRGPGWRPAWTPWWPCGRGPSPPASPPPARPPRRWERPQTPDTASAQELWGTCSNENQWWLSDRAKIRWGDLEAQRVKISGFGFDWERSGSQPVTMCENKEKNSECLAEVFRLKSSLKWR